MVSNKAAGLKNKRKLVAKQIKVESPQKEIHDSCAFSLVDNYQKQHMQPTETLKFKKISTWLRWQISKTHLFVLQLRKISRIIF